MTLHLNRSVNLTSLLQARILNDAESGTEQMVASDVLVGIGNATWSGTPRIVSWHPMAVVYDNFLTEEECDYILKLSKPRMEPAMLVNSKEQKHQRSKSRTSHGAFLDSFEDDVLSMITNRIAHVAKVPPGEFTDADGCLCRECDSLCVNSVIRIWALCSYEF